MTSSTIPGLLAVSPVGAGAGPSSRLEDGEAKSRGARVGLHAGETGAAVLGGRTPLRIVALDLSLKRTGVATAGRTIVVHGIEVHEDDPLTVRWNRLRLLRTDLRRRCLAEGADVVVVEGPSFGSNYPGAHERAGLWWLLYGALSAYRIPVAVVPPASLKKFATGNGNAGKPQMVAAAIRRLGYARHDDNEADALWLLEMARAHYGLPCVALPAKQTAALDGVPWPELVSS